MTKQLPTQEQMTEWLDKCYGLAMNGVAGEVSCAELAQEYMKKYGNTEEAVKKMVNAQITKCTASGFVTGLGGMITLPVAIPANVASVLYVQIRMIGALAVMGGYNLRDDEVKTLVYICLVKSSVTDIFKSAGVQLTNKMTISMLKKLPGKVLTMINQKVGFRLVTKFGEKGLVNLVKVVPVMGGIFGGTVDYLGTKAIAQKAYNMFLLGNIE